MKKEKDTLTVYEEPKKKTLPSKAEEAAFADSISAALKQKDENLFKASVRTHAPIDAGKICAMLGGGGHARAAGCAIKGNLEEVSEKILSAAKTVLGEI